MTPLLKAESFEFHVIEIARELRGRWEQADLSRLVFAVKVEGQTLTGDLKIEYELRDSTWGEAVTGGSVQAVAEEFLRRKGWREQNAPLCLPRVEDNVVQLMDIAIIPDKPKEPF